ncbi:MAG: AAA family ATPase [Bacteroidota bacterium]|nr:AAA family ATPase [Bacteroidota bacterium]
MESPADRTKLLDAESYLLQRNDQFVIIDEVQRMPEIFPILRSVIDKDRRNGRFLLLGSASPTLIKNSSETLAGRIHYLELSPLTFPRLLLKEIGKLCGFEVVFRKVIWL